MKLNISKSLLLGLATVMLAGCGKSSPPVDQVWDVTPLIGLNIDQAKAKLGPPEDDREPSQMPNMTARPEEWEKSWTKDKVQLMATYNGCAVAGYLSPCDTV